MVDAQPVDLALGDERDEQGVALREDLGVLDPDRDERVDVEEPAVVQLLVADPPVRQPVVLGVQQVGQRRGPRYQAGPATTCW